MILHRNSFQILLLVCAAVGVGAAIAMVDPLLLAACAGAATFVSLLLLLRWSLADAGHVFLAGALLTITWNGVTVVASSGSSVSALSPADLLLVPAFVFLLLHALAVRRPLPVPGWMLVGGGLMVVAALLSAAFPPHFVLLPNGHEGLAKHVVNLFKFEVALIVLPCMLMVAGSSSGRIRNLANWWVVSAVISALVAVSDFLGITDLSTSLTGIVAAEGREQGLTFQANHLAVASVMALPVALTWITRPGIQRLAGPCAASILLAGVYVSGSRTGVVAGLLVLILMFSALPPLRRTARRGALPVAMLVIVLLPSVVGWIGEAATQVRLAPGQTTSTALSNGERADAIARAREEFVARPITGVGFAVVYRAHDLYLQLLAAGGVIALVGFFVYVAGTAQVALRALATPDRTLAIALTVAVVAWLAAGVFANQLVDRYLYVPVGLLLAIVTVAETQRKAHSTPVRAGRSLRSSASLESDS